MRCFSPPCFWRDASARSFPVRALWQKAEPCTVELNLVVPTMSSGSSTRALTPEEESKIENLRVMVFRADGSVVTNGKYVSSGSKFTIDSYSGNSYTLFFIANVSNAEVEAKLQSAASLLEVEQLVTTASQLDFGMNTTHPLMMTGKQENVTFAPGNSTYSTPIQLHFIAAKVTLIVVDNTPSDHAGKHHRLGRGECSRSQLPVSAYCGCKRKPARHFCR